MRTIQFVVAGVFALGSSNAWAQAEEISASSVSEDASGGAASAPSSTVAEGDSPVDAVVGRYGVGGFTQLAPVGVRMWMDRNFAIDAGVDLAFTKGEVSENRFGLEAGAVYALAHYHYAVVFARGGLGLGRTSFDDRYFASLSGFFGAELFLGAMGFPNVSLQAGYGLQAQWTIRDGTILDVGFLDSGLNIVDNGQLGFHIYF